jgi:hypothetical protein
MLVRRPNSTVLAAVVFALAACGRAFAGTPVPPPRRINVHVDSVVASDTHEGVDSRLSSMGPRLQSLFSYTSYRLVSHQDGQTAIGNQVSFALPGGRILHVEPHEIDGDMIAMELVLFQGERPLMTTDLKLRNHGILIVGGPRYEQGMLIISIGADCPKLHSVGGAKPRSAATAATASE